MPEITSGPGFETLNVRAGAFTTFTFENVPDILILNREISSVSLQPSNNISRTYFIMG